MNKILSFDVSNNGCSVAISAGENILAYEEELRPSMQAECLLVMIENALRGINISYKDIEYLAVTNGPGSFTGIRIGLAVAKGILLASNIKGMAITNFEMAYYRATQQISKFDKIFILLDAYRNQVYFQEFDKSNKILLPKLVNKDEIKHLLTDIIGDSVCAGNGLATVYEDIKDISNLTILPRFARIKAIHVCRYANEKIRAGIISSSLEPLYIRPPDAEIPK